MLFQEGHTINVKLNTDALKEEAYSQYCAHIALGKAKKSWKFKHPKLSLTWETMEKYIKADPIIFDPIHKRHAEADGYAKWEQVVEDTAVGKNKDANVAALQMLMRNKFKWDHKDQVNDDDDGTSLVAHERLLDQLSKLQRKEPEQP